MKDQRVLRLVKDGPEIPLEVLAAHEAERLVFFCGAGISMDSGLPNFKGLVDHVYSELGESPRPAELAASRQGRLDKVIGLLEDRTVPRRVRQIVVERLTRPSPVTLVLHKALLELSKVQDGGYRLVTTNFDDRFCDAGLKEDFIDSAPKFSVPKPDVWRSLVHLHGRIRKTDAEGRHLVLTTSDFGTAYLTERWASRFITELAREFTILFIGYSVGDPVVAYMIDALAAERAKGRFFQKAFAFAPYRGGVKARDKQKALWEAKGVVPILYEQGIKQPHLKLNQTILQWASLFKGGLASRTQMAIDLARLRPTNADDDDARALVWALFEPGGTVAWELAKLDPCPPIEWLDIFDKSIIKDPQRKGAPVRLFELPTPGPKDPKGVELPFPTPLVDVGTRTTQPLPLHPATRALGYWLARHIDDLRVLEWVLAKGGLAHPEFRVLIRESLTKMKELPPSLRRIWEIVTSDDYVSGQQRTNLPWRIYAPPRWLPDGRLNPIARTELLRELAPFLHFSSRSIRIKQLEDRELPSDSERRISYYVEIEVRLAARDHVKSIVDEIQKEPRRTELLADLSDDLTSLLKKALDLFAAAGEANRDEDPAGPTSLRSRRIPKTSISANGPT